MVVIRLTRVGKKKQAHYRIVVAESKRAVQGKFISILGWYNPHTKELEVKKDELQAWFDKGAMPSNTLAKLLKKEGVKLPKWVKITEKKKAPKKKEEPKEKPAAAPKEEEAPAEEVKEEKSEEKVTETEAPVEEEKSEEPTKEEKPAEEPKEDK
ncbi:MAG: 30S ribosomal protein S16 [Patescibacteria group bacterium]